PEYMIPRTFVILSTLPLTPNGKVDRQALPAPDTARPDLETTFTAPRTTIEERLTAIWCETLGLDRVGIHDDFFELGGHSLLFLRLWTRLKDSFGQDYPVNVLFQYRTIDQFARFLQQPESAEPHGFLSEDPASAERLRPPLFCLNDVSVMAKY